MRLLKVRLNNVGVYAGEQELDLTVGDPSRPIILIQGTNGAGKTTLLESIRLALYGQRALGLRVRRSDYEDYLRNRVSRHGGDTAAATVTFSYVRAGVQSTYEVTRSWRRASNVREELILYEDGKPVSDVSQEQWEYFIRELIPPGLAELFFFDAERIRSLATTRPGDPQLTDSIKGLLGLDLAEQLQRDLATLTVDSPALHDNSSLHRQVLELQMERDRLNDLLQALSEERAQLEAEIQEVEKRFAIAEQQLASQGGSAYEKRKELEQSQQALTHQYEDLQRQIRETVAGTLPFALAGPIVQRLRDQLEAEMVSVGVAGLRDIWPRVLAALEASFSAKGVEDGTRQVALETVEEAWHEVAFNTSPGVVVHDVSATERHRILEWMTSSYKEAHHALRLFEELRDVASELLATRSQLQRIPKDDVLSPLVERFKFEARNLQQHSLKLGEIEQQERALRAQLAHVDRQLRQVEDRIQLQVRDQGRVQLADRVQAALSDYRRRLHIKKVQAFQDAFVGLFNSLMRKRNFITYAHVDPNTFALTLYRDDVVIPQSDLSAAEQQLYAIAVLWALRQVSGRPLPLVVDSPLGRLDRKHRTHLLERYFPYASHQVMILATDSEISGHEAKSLKPYLSAHYKLDHDARAGNTRILPVLETPKGHRSEAAG